MEYIYLIIPGLALILVLILIIAFHHKKKSVIKKVNSLSLSEDDMLDISLELNRYCNKRNCSTSPLGHMHKRHWWLTKFNMGTFTIPSGLFVNTGITFKNYRMMHAFLESFTSTLPDTPIFRLP